ncbi:MAG: TPM domain-containing protein, partial [Firmicutes bacterium]|nr:TPM domain-containing protein [Bacillota bacterium]
NDKNTPRLIDNADIFTEEEEAQIAPRLKEILDTYKEDVVVYTDITSYGIDNELYANDFYVYNGYGYGDTYDGLILFVNMDPDNREMITSACGQAKEIFTQYNSNALDDVLYDYFVQKNYGQGVSAWLDCVENLMHYGSLHVSEWYKNYIDGTQDPNASNYKLVDDIGYFDEETGKEIADELRSLKEEYGMDFVVYLTDQAYDINGEGLSDELKAQNYADTFYKAQGYDEDGVLLAIYTQESSLVCIQCRTFGKADAMFSDKIKSRLESLTLTNLGSGNYEKNITRYLSYLKTFLKTGRLPHTWPVRIMWACMCIFAGLILGSIQLGAAKAKMRVVKKATGARSELVNNSMKVLHSRDIYETTTVSKVYSPQKDNSNSRGSSGGSRSSYSSHSSSSSGRSFSSSRRKF